MAKPAVNFVVVTPEMQVVEGQAESVVIPMHDGELGVLRGRAPLMCELGIGQMRYTSGGKTRRVFIDGGFAQINDNEVTLLTSHALPAEDITSEMIADAEKAIGESQGATVEAAAARRRARRRSGVLRDLKPGR